MLSLSSVGSANIHTEARGKNARLRVNIIYVNFKSFVELFHVQLASSLFAHHLVFYRSYYRFFHDRDMSEYLNTFITSQINFL